MIASLLQDLAINFHRARFCKTTFICKSLARSCIISFLDQLGPQNCMLNFSIIAVRLGKTAVPSSHLVNKKYTLGGLDIFVYLRLPCELGPSWLTHRVISDRVHRLLVTLSYFRPDRFVQLLSLIPILILLLYYLVSGCLTSLC